MLRLINGQVIRAGVSAVALALSVTAMAAGGAKQGWSGKVGLGYLAASGNSDTTNVNANFGLAYDTERWRHSLKLLAIGADSDGTSTAERYALDLKSQYDITKFDYLFGLVAFDKDRFSGVEQTLSESLGYGRRLINSEQQVLNVEAGIGFQQLDFADGSDDSSALLRLGGDYKYVFNTATTFNQGLTIDITGDNTAIKSISSVAAKLADALNLVVSFTVKNNSDVPAGLKKTDTFTALNVEYGF